jgi:hypothetical protein
MLKLTVVPVIPLTLSEAMNTAMFASCVRRRGGARRLERA